MEERGTKHTSKAPKMFPTDALALHIPNTIPRLQKIKKQEIQFSEYITALKHLNNNSFVEF